MNIRPYYLVAVFITGAMLGFATVTFLDWLNVRCEKEYTWLYSTIGCEEGSVLRKAQYNSFENALTVRIEQIKNSGEVNKVAVYFRDLENGPGFGVNDRDPFIPASLLKVPLMITILKIAEDDPSFLERKTVFNGQWNDIPQQTLPKETLQLGGEYSIDELVSLMIAYSDNRAYLTLFNYLAELSPRQSLGAETLIDLGIYDADTADGIDQSITTRGYASVFRQLYNASYLPSSLSEKALEYLSRADYNDGLRKGIPEDIPIAHKFGERYVDEDTRQLHDCGIIYYPGNPYLLCVMTEGKEFPALAETIATISRLVWEEVEGRRL